MPGERIVTTEVFEGAPPSDAGDVLNTIDFVELGGRTRVDLMVDAPTRRSAT